MIKKIAAIIAGLLVWSCVLAAQENSASVTGTVRDVTGAAVAHAIVALDSPALGRIVHVTADDNGDYIAPAVPPGVYTVTASAYGFAMARIRNVDLALGKGLRIDLVLEVAPVRENVVIREAPPLVDTQSTKAAMNLSLQFLETIPKPRSFQNLAVLAPGAQLEGRSVGLQINGATGPENVWLIDGVDTTGLLSGGPAKNLLVDWVQELQVSSSGIGADSAGALGGVVNVITKSGGNDLHGDVRYYYYGSKLQTDPRPRLRLNLNNSRVAEYVNDPEDRETVHEVGFQLGGAVVKNRLWYFVGYQPTLDHTSRDVFFVGPKITRGYANDKNTQYWTGRFTFQPWDRLRTNVSVTSNSQTSVGVLPSYNGTQNPNGGFELQGSRTPNVTYRADAQWTAAKTLFLSARLGYFFADSHSFPFTKQIRYYFFGTPANYFDQLPPEFRQQTGWSNILSNYGLDHDSTTRLNGGADGSWFIRFYGNHNLKFGYQANRLGEDVLNGTLDDVISVGFDETAANPTMPGVSTGKYGYYYNEFYGSRANINSYNHAIYAQDAWQPVRRLTLNLGLRAEHENVPSYRTDSGINSTAIRFPFSSKLAPRFGFAYDLKGDGKSKVYGSFGLYYDMMKYWLSSASFGGSVDFADSYTLDTLDIGSIGHGNYPGQKIGRTDFRVPANAIHPELGGINLIDPNIKPTQTREYTAGYERALSRDWMMSVRYTRTRLVRTIEDIGVNIPGVGITNFIGNPGEGITRKMYGPGCNPLFGGEDCAEYPATPQPSRRYDGLEVRAQGRWANWQSVVSYDFSRLYGNYSGLSSSDFPQGTPNWTSYYDLPYSYVDAAGRYIDGPLATDRMHTLKYYGSYRLPVRLRGLTVGVVLIAGSGIPTTRTIGVMGTGTLIEGRNSEGRRGANSVTNLYVAQDFKVSERSTMRLDFTLENAFNQSTALNYYTNYTQNAIVAGIPGSAIQKGADATKGYDYKKQIELQANYNRPAGCGSFTDDPYCPSAPMRLDPQFLQPNVFRGPLTGRFSLRFMF